MPGAQPRLTARLVRELCERIKAGAFEQVAAESLGVPFALYRSWLARGRRAGAGRFYRQLAQDVRQALAHARFMAESALRTEAPKVWLLSGPGRETRELPGWTAPARPRQQTEAERLDVFSHPEVVALLNDIAKVLLPFPEARTAVLRILDAGANA